MITLSTHYGTLTEGEAYFLQRLNSQAWDQSTPNDQTAALFQATRAIDRLNFVNEKTVATQELQFPRGEDTEIPGSVCVAAYECAIKYLEGVDLDMEARNLGIAASSFGGVRTTFNPEFLLEHLRAGIPSVEAWYHLRPFLRDPGDLIISRAS